MSGASSLALEHYRALNLKQVQTDTLSHLTLSRSSTFALSSLGDLTYSTECMEASQIYLNNANEVIYHRRIRVELAKRSLDCRIHRTSIHPRKVLSGKVVLYSLHFQRLSHVRTPDTRVLNPRGSLGELTATRSNEDGARSDEVGSRTHQHRAR